MRVKALALAVSAALSFHVCTAFADGIACVSGSLATIVDTTCNIGTLQFTFGPMYGSDNEPGVVWPPSDFIFTVLANGFELSGLPAQSATSAVNGNTVLDDAYLSFFVADLAGQITGASFSGGNLFTSGTGSFSYAQTSIYLSDFSLVPFADVQSLDDSNILQDVNGTVTDYSTDYATGPLLFGLGDATLFDLLASDGNAAGISSTTTNFTFATVAGPLNPPAPNPYATPEPGLLALLSVGVLGLGFWKRRARK